MKKVLNIKFIYDTKDEDYYDLCINDKNIYIYANNNDKSELEFYKKIINEMYNIDDLLNTKIKRIQKYDIEKQKLKKENKQDKTLKYFVNKMFRRKIIINKDITKKFVKAFENNNIQVLKKYL